MNWNWVQKNWPNFHFDQRALRSLEAEFLNRIVLLRGSIAHLKEENETQLTVEILREESLATSKIEGELLDRAIVQFPI